MTTLGLEFESVADTVAIVDGDCKGYNLQICYQIDIPIQNYKLYRYQYYLPVESRHLQGWRHSRTSD